MKTKPRDVAYCGVDVERIKTAKPKLNMSNVKHLMRFVRDRYGVHLNKDVYGMDKPWTNNSVLQQFRFTNVRREHDRQTRYLIDHIIHRADFTLEDKIVNVFMFRAWNNWDTMRDFGGPWKARNIYSPELKETARTWYEEFNKADPKRMWWSNAYNQGGTKHAWSSPYNTPRGSGYKEEKDIPLRPFHIGPWLKQQNIVDKLLNSKDQQEAFEVIKFVRGFADFLAYQVFVDLTYIPEFLYSENEFVIAGPGCKKGLDYIFSDRAGMTYEECIFWLRDNWTKLSERVYTLTDGKIDCNPKNIFVDLDSTDRVMNVMSIENCMCELSKYIRTVEGTGRPKNKYKGA